MSYNLIPSRARRAGQPDLVSKAEIASAELSAVARSLLDAVGWAIDPASNPGLFGQDLLDHRPLPEGTTGASVLRLLNYKPGGASSSSSASSASSASSSLPEHVDRGLLTIIISNQPGLLLFDQVQTAYHTAYHNSIPQQYHTSMTRETL